MTEQAIIAGCLQNDAAAQRELYNRYSPKMLSVCYRFAPSREDAEDMLQEGFIKVFTQIHFHFKVTGKNLKPATVERAVQLSHDKYCSASIMLAKTAGITHSVEIVGGE